MLERRRNSQSEFLRENGEQLFLKLKEENYGRAQREFIRVAALNAGYLIDFSRITQEDMIYASKESFLCNYRPMQKLLSKCIFKSGDIY